jgi:hypothetical protein
MGSNQAEDGFLRIIKICSMTSFRGEAQPLALCSKILLHVNPAEYEIYTFSAKFTAISC